MSGQRYSSYLLNQMWPDVTFLRAQVGRVLLPQKKSRMSSSWDTSGSAWLLKDAEHFMFMVLKKPMCQRNPLLALAIHGF